MGYLFLKILMVFERGVGLGSRWFVRFVVRFFVMCIILIGISCFILGRSFIFVLCVGCGLREKIVCFIMCGFMMGLWVSFIFVRVVGKVFLGLII